MRRRSGSSAAAAPSPSSLPRTFYLSSSRSYFRKAREAAITVFMEWLLPKDRILELYLNSIEFGPGIFGVEEAARYHFNTSARNLTLYQCCQLAAIIPCSAAL